MKGKFAITLTTHRILGPLFNPVVINLSANREYYTVTDRLSLANLEKYSPFLFPEQIDLIKSIEEYSDNQLLKVFSKKKMSAQDFLSSMDDKVFTQQVRPYIERRLFRCIEFLSGSDTPVFIKKQHNNIYESDRVWIQEDRADAVFNFIRKPDGLQYFLTVSYGEEIIKLTGKAGILLVNDPCRMVLENRLFQFDDIDGKKLLPFFEKQSITIGKNAEIKYLESFVRTAIQKYKVNAEGFKVTDLHPVPKPVLSLENSLSGTPVFILRFRYDEKNSYSANRKSDIHVMFCHTGDEVEFKRMNRDDAFENSLISSLLAMGLANQETSAFIPLRSGKTDTAFLVYDLVNWLNLNSEELTKLGVDIAQSFASNNYYLKQYDLKLKVSESQNDWFDIQAVVIFDSFEIPFVRFRQHILSGRREYELPDHRIVILPQEWFARFKELFTFAKDEKDQLILEKQHFPLLKESLQGHDGSYASRLKKWLDTSIYDAQPVPPEIRADLRDYQCKGYSWMWNLYNNDFGGCLADDMGLGKTLQTLTLLQQAINTEKLKHYGPVKSTYERQLTIFDSQQEVQGKVKPTLIIVPSSLVHNWINEICKFAPQLKTGNYGGPNRKPFRFYYDTFDLIVASYGLVRNDIEVVKSFEFLYVVLDESQVIKNPHSKTYKAIICLNAAHRLVLTGTPIENSLTDLWAQMNFLNPGLLGNFEFFTNEFVAPIEKMQNKNQSRILQTLIKPFVLRRNKNEVAKELPELTEQVIYCQMSESQLAFYETEKSKARNLILDNITHQGIEKSSFVILQSLTKLRQVANHPVLIDKTYSDDSGKHDVIIDNIENLIAEGHKALIFSSFVKHLDLYTEYCNRKSIKYTLLTGDVPQHKREEIIKRFQEDCETHLFFISIKSGGFGLNLTAADYVFILDPWWNPAVEDQAMSRAHRIGQYKNVFVYRFIAKDTIEEKISILQEKKSQLAESFINSNNLFKASDKDEILKLLE